MAIYCAIDPGARGACCLLNSATKEAMFIDNPPKTTGKEVFEIIQMAKPEIVMVENVHSIFGVSAKSNFSFGFNTGGIRMIAELAGFGVDLVNPKAWQKAVGVPAFPPKSSTAFKKKSIAATALRLYPNAANSLSGPRGGLLDGRVDALLIAHYAMLKYSGRTTT